ERRLGGAGDRRQHLRHVGDPAGLGDRLEPRGVGQQPRGQPHGVDEDDRLHTVRVFSHPENTMQTRRLGNSDLSVIPIGFGAWAIGGGGWAFAWGPQDDAQSVAAIREAIDLGVNWIDTAPVYGLGHSEEVVGKALEGVRNRPYVFTKCARVWNANRRIGKSLKAVSIRRGCEASLRPLKVD